MALDVYNLDDAKALVEQLGDQVQYYKLGLQLCMTGDYFDLVNWLVQEKDKKVFADLKLFDIPRTVASAVENLRDCGAALVTLHTGHTAMLEAASAVKGKLQLLGVTVLTSMTQEDFQDVSYQGNMEALVEARARQAMAHGCDGVVCSGLEAATLRQSLGQDALIVTPGIRPSGEAEGDQLRVVDVPTAFTNGADYIVVGRPIHGADDPHQAAQTIQQQILDVFKE